MDSVKNQDAYTEYEQMLVSHLEHLHGHFLGNPRHVTETIIRERIALKRGRASVSTLKKHVDMKGKKLLDVGSGWGELLLSSLENGAVSFGVEPDGHEIRISKLLFKSYGISRSMVSKGIGESLPFKDDTFDIVTCTQVLEHVSHIGNTVKELVRVTKPGGILFVSAPNYLFPYEGHYRVKWISLTPKRLGKHILRAMGRNPEFLMKHVRYTTYPYLVFLWKRHGLDIRNLTDEALRAGLRKNRGRIVRFLSLYLKLYPNVTWLLRKPDPESRSMKNRQASRKA